MSEESKGFGEETKETANDFKKGAKEALNDFSTTIGGENKRVLAGVLALVLGYLGVHKFVLGYQNEGFILLGITVLGYATMCLLVGALIIWIPIVIGFIEGIIYLTKSDEEFYEMYQKNKKPWF